MMKTLAIVLALIGSVYGSESWKAQVYKTFPKPLQKLIPGKTSQKDVEKNLGKASLVEKNKQYYELDQLKYALEVTYNNQVVKEFSYTYTQNQPDFSEFKMDPKLLSPDEGTRFLKYSDKEIDLLVDLASKKIYSVRVKK